MSSHLCTVFSTDKEMRTQRGAVTCLRSHSWVETVQVSLFPA